MKKLLQRLALVCITILFITGTSYSANEQSEVLPPETGMQP